MAHLCPTQPLKGLVPLVLVIDGTNRDLLVDVRVPTDDEPSIRPDVSAIADVNVIANRRGGGANEGQRAVDMNASTAQGDPDEDIGYLSSITITEAAPYRAAKTVEKNPFWLA